MFALRKPSYLQPGVGTSLRKESSDASRPPSTPRRHGMATSHGKEGYSADSAASDFRTPSLEWKPGVATPHRKEGYAPSSAAYCKGLT